MQVCAGVQGGRRREWDLLLELTGALGPNRSSARAVCAANPERPLQAPTLNFSWFTCNASFHFLNTYKIRVAYEFLGRTDSKINLRNPAAEVHCFRRQHIPRCQLPMEEGGDRPLGQQNKWISPEPDLSSKRFLQRAKPQAVVETQEHWQNGWVVLWTSA